MTVIAWDGKTLAADRMASNNYLQNGRYIKIWREKNGWLCAWSGVLSIALELREWYRLGCRQEAFPPSARDIKDPTRLLVIKTDGTKLLYSTGPFPETLPAGIYAMGGGFEAAWAVLMMQGTAIQAVEIASELCIGCGGGFDALEL